MHLSFCAIAVSTLTLIVSSTLAPAAEVRVLSVGSTQIAAKAIAGEFEKQTGHKVIFTIRPPFNIEKELAEKTAHRTIERYSAGTRAAPPNTTLSSNQFCPRGLLTFSRSLRNEEQRA